MADRRNVAAAAPPPLGAERRLKWTLSAPQLDKQCRRTRPEREGEDGGGASTSSCPLFFSSSSAEKPNLDTEDVRL